MSKAIVVSGKVSRIGETQSFGSNGFEKKELVVEEKDGQYTQHIGFNFVKDKINLLSNISVGDEVSVEGFLRGREYDNKQKGITQNFISLDAWKIDKTGEAQEKQPNKLPVGGDDINGEEDDLNLPF